MAFLMQVLSTRNATGGSLPEWLWTWKVVHIPAFSFSSCASLGNVCKSLLAFDEFPHLLTGWRTVPTL